MAAFVALRDGFETTDGVASFTAAGKAAAIVSLPAIGFAAAKRAVPPPALRFGLYGAALMHGYDRVYKAQQPHVGNMGMSRRQW